MDFLESMRERAQAGPRKIVFPEGEEPRVISAVKRILELKTAYPILLGDVERISKMCEREGFDPSGVELINPADSDRLPDFSETYYELRKHKGITREEASEAIKDPVFFGAMMLKKDLADGYVCGSATTTAKTVQAGLRIIGMQPGIRVLSGAFVMIHPEPRWGKDGLFLYADTAVTPNPSAEGLAEIALTTAKTARNLLNTEPYVAMLSFSTKGSARHEDVDKVVRATKIAAEREPSLKIDGEMQFDAAVIEKTGQKKAPGSPVPGKANVFIFPDLDAGNIAYKITQYLGGARAIGPILQGMVKPANDLSRGCSVEDIVNLTAITVVQAQDPD